MERMEAVELRAGRHYELQYAASADLELSRHGVALFGFGYAAVLILRALFFGVDVPGYTSIMVVVLVLGGTILVSLGVIGEYLGRIFEESKGRPLFVARSYIGFEKRDDSARCHD